MLAGMQHAEHIGIGYYRRDGNHATTECLAQQIDVGNNVPVVAGKHSSGAGETRLDFVGDEQNIVLGAQCADGGQVVVRRDDDAGLALNGLQQDGDGVAVDRPLQGGGIAEWHDAESGSERSESAARGLIGGEAHDADGSTVEVIVCHHDIGLIHRHALDVGAPFTGHLDTALDGLGPGVHRQHHALAAEPGEVAAEPTEAIRMKRPAHQCHRVELGVRGREDFGIPVAEVHGRVGGQTVQVSLTVHILDPRALGPVGDDR
ncbi:Uncharacterised protein [Mycobacteroides abscessus subsp. abscessus]|nr:Uncharacterised protein [Mycobacteroides abscessus subsp. abscessus]